MAISVIPDVAGVGNSARDSSGLNNNFKVVQQNKASNEPHLKDLGTQSKAAKEFGTPVDAGAGVGLTKVNTAESTKASITETGKGARISQLI